MLSTKRSIAVQSAILLCAILVCSCGLALAQDVKYNFAAGTDFSKFKTYKWVEIKGGAHPDQLVNDQIKQAIDSQLAAKGLTKTESDEANLYIDYQLAVTQEIQWDAMSYGGGRYGRMGGMGTATSSTINIGTLVLDMYDSAAKKQVWRGDATKTLNPSKDPAKNQERLQKAVAKLLKNYPPPVKK
jgi:hypothetical protein